MTRRRLLWFGVIAAGGLAVVVMLGFDNPSREPAAVVACVDSTKSTDDVRGTYLPDLESVARSAAEVQAHFYAADCGPNAAGTVRWPVDKQFESTLDYHGVLAKRYANKQVGSSRFAASLQGLTEEGSGGQGTPIGEMLGVAARQCNQAGGDCDIYIFTDGEWADGLIKVSDGVSRAEEERYVEAYAPRLGDLAGSQVNFVGVGFGTEMGEIRLGEAEDVAAALVQAAGGRMGIWATRL